MGGLSAKEKLGEILQVSCLPVTRALLANLLRRVPTFAVHDYWIQKMVEAVQEREHAKNESV